MATDANSAYEALCRAAAQDVSGLTLLYLGFLARLALVEEGEGDFAELSRDALRAAEETAFAARLLELEASKLSRQVGDITSHLLEPLRLVGQSLTLLATASSADDAKRRPLASAEEIERTLKTEPIVYLLKTYG